MFKRFKKQQNAPKESEEEDKVPLNEFKRDQVQMHRTKDDCWLIIGPAGKKKVYDITAFLDDHPGGPELLLDLAGQDAQDEFEVTYFILLNACLLYDSKYQNTKIGY
jgi:cytochrome b involved in lipid metabolism